MVKCSVLRPFNWSLHKWIQWAYRKIGDRTTKKNYLLTDIPLTKNVFLYPKMQSHIFRCKNYPLHWKGAPFYIAIHVHPAWRLFSKFLNSWWPLAGRLETAAEVFQGDRCERVLPSPNVQRWGLPSLRRKFHCGWRGCWRSPELRQQFLRSRPSVKHKPITGAPDMNAIKRRLG